MFDEFKLFSVSYALVFIIGLSGCVTSPDAYRPYPTAVDASVANVGWEPGDILPDVAFKTPDGEDKVISDYRGTPLFVNFWAKWCGPCRREMPSLAEVYPNLSAQGLQLIFLNMYEPYDIGVKWADEEGYSFPLFDSYNRQSRASTNSRTALRNAEGSVTRYTPGYIPRTFLVDRNGVIVRKFGSKVIWTQNEAAIADFTANSAPLQQ